MVIGILQPGYLPWLGFFEQLYRSDVFVIYDDVQYDKQSWRNRNRIKTTNGAQWLTVPVCYKYNEHPRTSDIRIDNRAKWAKKHFQSIRQSYAKAPYFDKYIGEIEMALGRTWDYLVDLDMHFIELIAGWLDLGEKKIVRSSELNVSGERNERLVKICNLFGADVFYEGAAGRNYIDEERFRKESIQIEYQDYDHPEYDQMHGGFLPYLSIIDLLFNTGPDAGDILIGE